MRWRRPPARAMLHRSGITKGADMSAVFETPRLRLRHLREEDGAFFLELVNDPDWVRFIGERGLRTVEQARVYLQEKLIRPYARWGFGLYAVDSRETGEPIGICGLLRREQLDDADLGFAFLPRARGQGFAQEAAEATLVHARENLGLQRVVAIVQAENARSLALLEKLGFRYERPIRLPPSLHRELLVYGRELAGSR